MIRRSPAGAVAVVPLGLGEATAGGPEDALAAPGVAACAGPGGEGSPQAATSKTPSKATTLRAR